MLARSCLDEALQQAIRDSQQFFHIAPQRLIGSTVFVEEDNSKIFSCLSLLLYIIQQ